LVQRMQLVRCSQCRLLRHWVELRERSAHCGHRKCLRSCRSRQD
jgi:hypothetical protein